MGRMFMRFLVTASLMSVLAVNSKETKDESCHFYKKKPCAPNVIKFYLYSSDFPETPAIVLDNYNPIVPRHIDLTYKTKLLIPGYAENIYLNETRLIREEYLKQHRVNVLTIDWLRLSELPCYPSAVFNVRQAGKCTANFLERLQGNNPKFSFEDLHVIGLSLGAHMPSFTSDMLQAQIGVKLKRITGLDPALPMFRTATRRWKLDPSDANFVDVIHTNGGLFGKLEPCGHVDFYVNGGRTQPACKHVSLPVLCSHLMALAYYTESISTNVGFWTTQCDSYFEYIFTSCRFNVASPRGRKNRTQILMGEYCPTSARGIYFVQTKTTIPYALGLHERINNIIL
ncbi:pancreatic lipase-related protein 2-like [Topomyia yanbarensis]|uniref:pancreatic lipase-related protein 2-like n=1 Tax=Topomyia yanbarensis TaxID=2498891 RepID=UPI00273AB777|nr:pancreatic lipase-related protein 2-like [Topomyia yanbarensis]